MAYWISEVRGEPRRTGALLLRDLAAQAAGLDAVVMTGKDWVKVRPLLDCTQWPVPIVVPQLALEVFEGGDALADLVLSTVSD